MATSAPQRATIAELRPGGQALALYRPNAVDAAVKGALEHGLP